jgi:predicted RNA-binding protein with RPS1 domain
MEVRMTLSCGQVIDCTVTGIQPYGAFVTCGENYTGLIHISELSDDFVRNINHFVRLGETIKCKVIDIDEANRHVRLSLKAMRSSRAVKRMTKNHKNLPDGQIGFSSVAEQLSRWINERGKWYD